MMDSSLRGVSFASLSRSFISSLKVNSTMTTPSLPPPRICWQTISPLRCSHWLLASFPKAVHPLRILWPMLWVTCLRRMKMTTTSPEFRTLLNSRPRSFIQLPFSLCFLLIPSTTSWLPCFDPFPDSLLRLLCVLLWLFSLVSLSFPPPPCFGSAYRSSYLCPLTSFN